MSNKSIEILSEDPETIIDISGDIEDINNNIPNNKLTVPILPEDEVN